MTLDLSSIRRHTPNSFTRELGQLVRQAREARELSQAQVAKAIQRRQGTISDIENGKTEPDTSTLLLLAEVLDKPYTYFIPPKWTHRADIQNLDPVEQELIVEFRRLRDPESRLLILEQVQALIDVWLRR